MNHIRWAAWGVIDIEKIPSDHTSGGNGQARREYLKKVRQELTALNMILHVGGSKVAPWYAVARRGEEKNAMVSAGTDAFKKLCAWVLEHVGDVNVSGENGGVRGAGDEAQGEPGVAVAERAVSR